MIYFTADTHFSQERTLQFSRRPFFSVKEMDKILINNWNSVVSPEDKVYHLGDFGDSFEIAQDLNGKIILLVGNYERNKDLKIISKYFYEVIDRDLHVLLISENEELNLVHEPSNMESNRFNCFGHVHQLSLIKRFQKPNITNLGKFSANIYQECLGLNVGVDCHQFKPISLDVIKFYENAIKNHYDGDVFLGSPYTFSGNHILNSIDVNQCRL